ncbi:MAG: SDR family oxidoreductase [Alphaproteobacteria bacterium]|nr:SDR family oxidoreductase [Alphaproteobacteria bacterium]
MDRLKGKVAVITGGSSGIGLGTVERFAAEGARVMVGDIDEASGRAIEARFDGEVAFRRCDVTEEGDIASLMDAAAERFGGLDVVFNNAGAGGARETLAEMTGEAWDRTHALLLRSVALGMRYAIPHMKRRGRGSIINTASIAGMQAGAGPIAYSTMKAAVIHLTRLAAAELGRDSIRVNAICPGLILTNIFTPGVPQGFADMIKAEMRQSAPEAQPIPKGGEPADIANAALFFASDESEFVTGVHMLVDGGMHTGPRQAWDPELRGARIREREERLAAWRAEHADEV